MTLLALHGVLQHAMGWTDSHLHQFRQGKALYGEPDDELGPEFGLNRRDESRVRLADVLRKPKDRMIYEYDFGDSWEHDVVLEKITPAKSESQLPRVVAGQRACPPEDCGGMHG